MLADAYATDRPVFRGFTTREEKTMSATIMSVRGVRAAWGEMLDGLIMGAYALGGGAALTDADRVLLVVRALKMWPDNAVTTMVDRVMMVEATLAEQPALDMLADRHVDTWPADAIFRPVLFASSVRELREPEIVRLIASIRAAGVEPALFGFSE